MKNFFYGTNSNGLLADMQMTIGQQIENPLGLWKTQTFTYAFGVWKHFGKEQAKGSVQRWALQVWEFEQMSNGSKRKKGTTDGMMTEKEMEIAKTNEKNWNQTKKSLLCKSKVNMNNNCHHILIKKSRTYL